MRAHIADDELHPRQRLLDGLGGFDDADAVSVGGVDRENVHLPVHQFLGAFQKIARRADGRAHPQASLIVLRGVGIFEFFLDVLDCDQALQVVLVVDHKKFFDAMAVQDLLGLFQRRPDGNRDEVFLRHHVRHRQVETRFEAQIAVRQDADQFALACDRNPRYPIPFHQRESVGNLLFRADGDRIDDHPAFTAFHTIHLFGLAVDGHVAMDESYAALLRQRNGEMRFGDRVHGGADDRNIQRNRAREMGARIRFGGQNFTARRDEQDIVKGQPLGDRILDHWVVPV